MIDITKLNNGLRVVNEYMEDVESVSVNVIVKTGSRNETKQNNGISHFLEHMAFKGTLTRNVQQIAEEFDDIGGTANAFTSTAKTAFYTKVLKEYTEKGVEILADILQNSVFLEEEIEKERQVILQELAMTKDDPTDIVVDYFSETQYANQPYGRSILGPAKNIRKFTRDDIINYISKQYRTEDIVVSFAGKLKNDEAVKMVEKYFTSLNKGKSKEPQKAVYTGGYFVKNKKLEQTQILLGFESFNNLDDHYYEACVLAMILGGGMSSKLFQEIREKRGLCYTVSATNNATYDTGSFDIYCAVSPEKTNETITAILEEIKKGVKTITEEECQRAIVKFKSHLLMSKESNSNRAQRNGSNLLTKNRIVTTEELIEKIDAVKTKNVKDLIEVILNKSQSTVTILGKVDKDILTFEKIKEIIKK